MKFPVSYIRWVRDNKKIDINNMGKDLNENMKYLLDIFNKQENLKIPILISEDYTINEIGTYMIDTSKEITIFLPNNPYDGYLLNLIDYSFGNNIITIKSKYDILNDKELKIDDSYFNFYLLFYNDKWYIK